MRLLRPLVFCLPFLTVSWLHAGPTLYDQGSPTNEEQYLLQKLNRARLDPAGEGQRLADWLRNTADGKSVARQYGINPDQVASLFAALPVAPALALDPHLLTSARAHSTDLAAHGGTAPNGQDGGMGYDGSSFASREQAAGFDQAPTGESIAPGFSSLELIHAAYLVDWGNPDPGHRRMAMDSTMGTNVVGIGLATITNSTSLVETEDYGAPFLVAYSNNGQAFLAPPDVPAMLTGVVYHDANGNGQYDMGEGVAGVTITMDGGNFYAVTSASGGYAFPLVNANGSNVDGPVTVRAKFADGSAASKSVTVARFREINYFPGAPDYGTYRGNVEWEVTGADSSSLPAFFQGANALAQGWNYLAFSNGSLFGYYNAANYPFLYHNDMGWEYVLDANDGHAGVYLYDFASGSWFYTSPTFGFPYLYDFSRNAVVYYYPDTNNPGHYSNAPRYFYDYSAGKIITL